MADADRVNGSGRRRTTYARVHSRIAARLLHSPLVALGAHWLFQSLPYMDRSERLFKLAFDLGIAFPGALLLSSWLPPRPAWISALLTAHTLNFLFNGHLWGVLKHYCVISNSYAGYLAYVSGFLQRAAREDSIQYTVVCGSLSRQTWSPAADLDARLIRRPGLKNGLRVAWFLLRERSAALFARFPLDVYMLDNELSLHKLAADEPLIVIEPLLS